MNLVSGNLTNQAGSRGARYLVIKMVHFVESPPCASPSTAPRSAGGMLVILMGQN